MKWIVNMKIKDYVRNWSDQEIKTEYKGVCADIKIKDTNCELILEGNENIKTVFKLIWELLFLYDGYFYEPISFEIDGHKKDCKELFTLSFYKTDKKWYHSELLGRSKRNLATNVLEKYDKFRNMSISDKKMTKSLVNAFYYLNSENYGKINVNHRLSLLLNIADGFVINTFKETNNVKASLDRFFKKTVDSTKLQQGISLLGVDGQRYKVLLTEERHTFDHYKYSENSLATFVFDSEDEITDYATWYFVYVIELVIRINFLKESGVLLEQDYLDYALEVINDWIIYENDLEVDCKTHHYLMKQELKRKGIIM
ncbi:hypothetical protein H8S37_03010 [Mediterraneibacter sp. NSJ-55]|uniref:Uncharacterized protein n=1 Tax=Mediterraneibacter hominis TaxID=2763054 RepID=A0A923LFU0_9FIRM|nr:hypothetical protein [Mediterraneibacter hominis]MBC5687910.1 hypothetical protein [Mediterraneibacter hominis]